MVRPLGFEPEPGLRVHCSAVEVGAGNPQCRQRKFDAQLPKAKW